MWPRRSLCTRARTLTLASREKHDIKAMLRDFLTDTQKQQAGIRPEDDGLAAQYKWSSHQNLKSWASGAFAPAKKATTTRERIDLKRTSLRTEQAEPTSWRGAVGGLLIIVLILYGIYWATGGLPQRRASFTRLESTAELNQRCEMVGRGQQFRGDQFARESRSACIKAGPRQLTIYGR